LAQTGNEPAGPDARLPGGGRLLDLPEPPVLVLHVRPVDQDGEWDMLIRLRNASEESRTAVIGSGALSIAGARLPTVDADSEISITDGSARVRLDSRDTVSVRLALDR
jgi:hypothetical protein